MAFEFSKQDRQMLVHHYDEHGFYMSSGEETILAGEGLAANTTTITPPLHESDEILQFSDGQWLKHKNLIGKVAYSKANNEAENFVIETLGELPETHTLLEPDQYDSWDEESQAWIFDATKKNAALIEDEKAWQSSLLYQVELAIISAKNDFTIPEQYSELRVYSESQYYGLLNDRKLLSEYVKQPDFPTCGRPKLSGVVTIDA